MAHIRVGNGIYRRSLLTSAAACSIGRISDATISSSGSSSGFSRLSSPAPSDLFWWLYQEVVLTGQLGSEESCCGAGNCSINSGQHDDRDMERLLEQLDVAWVAHAGRDIRSSGELQHLTATWLRALAEILHTYSYFRRQHTATDADGGHFFCLVHRRYWQEGSGTPNQLNFTRFAGAAISRLLPFVDALVVPPRREDVDEDGALPAQKLQALIQVRGALTRTHGIAELPSSTSATEVASVHGELRRLLSAKLAKLDEAVWDTMEEVRARAISPTTEDDSNDGSSGVHKMTRSVLSYINLLEADYGVLHRIVYQAAKLRKCAPAGIGNIGTLASLKLEMLSCLEEKLDEESQSFPDESLRYLFLLNNLHFVQQQFLQMSDMKFHMPLLDSKIDYYMQRYLQVSWAPLLSCFHSPTPLCLGRHSSPVPSSSLSFRKLTLLRSSGRSRTLS